jgi:hypothetical protein
MPRTRPKKRRLSPLQREILWMLEEAGAETIPTIMVTLRSLFPSLSYDEAGTQFAQESRLLWLAGLVELCRNYHAPDLHYVRVSEEEHKTFFSTFQWSEEKDDWTWESASVTLSDMSIALTDVDREALTK